MAENSINSAPRGRPFPKGLSGNPGGRPLGLRTAVRELVGEDRGAIAAFWARVMVDDSAGLSDRLEASKLLAERGWGKPVQAIDLGDQAAEAAASAADVVERVARALSDEEADAILRTLRTAVLRAQATA